jgi:predicted GNAT family N-acyltransferase
VSFTVRPASWSEDRDALHFVRETVFVHEQGVPPVLEWDGLDETAEHVLVQDDAGQAVGCGRLVPDRDAAHLGRMAVLRDWRRRGAGHALLEALLDAARKGGFRRVWLNAQTYATEFYAKFGFRSVGEEFLDAGIPHCRMERDL